MRKAVEDNPFAAPGREPHGSWLEKPILWLAWACSVVACLQLMAKSLVVNYGDDVFAVFGFRVPLHIYTFCTSGFWAHLLDVAAFGSCYLLFEWSKHLKKPT